MALKSAWAYKNGKRMMAESRKALTDNEIEKAIQAAIDRPRVQAERIKKESSRLNNFETFWTALAPGIDLNIIGICGIIKKKNKKSIVLNSGSKWTKKELSHQF